MATRIQLRRDTAANWTSENPILSSGEPGYETDSVKYKIGDGATAWDSLSYFSGSHWVTISGTHTVTVGGQNIFTDTTGGAFTITMYDNPVTGQTTTFMDKGGYSNTNNVTVSGGAEKFNGENQYLYLNENYGSFTLVYGDTNSGWMSTTFPPFMTLDQA